MTKRVDSITEIASFGIKSPEPHRRFAGACSLWIKHKSANDRIFLFKLACRKSKITSLFKKAVSDPSGIRELNKQRIPKEFDPVFLTQQRKTIEMKRTPGLN
jgi:hypothetical protein